MALTASSGKKYKAAVASYDREALYTPAEATEIVKKCATAKFDESVEVAVRLGVDPRKADQMIRGTVALPSGTGKTVRIAVFANGEAAQAARDAGADLMPLVGRLGRVLGPRGLMPNPKTGTVTQDVARAVGEFKGGKVEYRTDRYGNVHVPIGKASFSAADLTTNLLAVLDEIQRAKPAAAKGKYLRKVSIASTMGPGVKVDTNRLKPEAV
jgi:large subunit ribosomal protein L1